MMVLMTSGTFRRTRIQPASPAQNAPAPAPASEEERDQEDRRGQTI